MKLHWLTESFSEFKQKRLIFQDTSGTIEHAPSAPNTKSQLRVLSLSIIMAMKNGGTYSQENFTNWSSEKKDEHYRKLAQTMPKNFNEDLFFSAKNPYLQELESNISLYVPTGMSTDDVTEADINPEGRASVKFKHDKSEQWIKFESDHILMKAIKWTQDQLKEAPNPTKDQVETIVGTMQHLRTLEGQTVISLLNDEENPDGEKAPEKPETPSAIHTRHADFHETTYKTPGKVAEVITNDRGTLGKASIEDIRQKSQLLVNGKTENNDQKKSFVVEETARRLRAYCDKGPNGWFVLNYSRVGGDAHQENIGLGDILLDPDITEIEVKKKSGKVYQAHRGIVESGPHKGRIGFIADGKPYVDTYDGDMFKIKSTNSYTVDEYVKKADEEQKTRAERPVTISTDTSSGRAKIEQELREEPITYKSPDTTIKDSDLTVKMIQEAEKEAQGPTAGPTKEKAFEQVLNRANFMAVVNYAAKYVGVPPWIILATMFHEARFNFLVKNKEGDEERGIGQFKKAAWISTRSDAGFISTMEQVINEDPRKMERQKSILADTLAIAISIKRALKEGGSDNVSYQTSLSQEQLEKIRWFYHVPSYFRCIRKEGQGYSPEFYEKAKAFLAKTQSRENAGKYGYKNFADTSLQLEALWKTKFKTD